MRMCFTLRLNFTTTIFVLVSTITVRVGTAQDNFKFPGDALKAWAEINSTLSASDYSETTVIICKYHLTLGDDHREGIVESIRWTIKSTNNMFLETGVPAEANNADFVGIARCVNDEYSFDLAKNELSDSWFVKLLLKGDDKEKSSARRQGKFVRSRMFDGIYFGANWPCTLAEIFESEYCRIIKAEPVFSLGRNKLLEVHFSINNAPTSEFPPIELGIMRFDPARKWIPISWEINLQGGGKQIASNSKFNRKRGIYIPSLQTWQIYDPDGTIMREHEYRQDFRFVKSPRYDFSLAAFGIPEISDNFKKPPFPYFTVTVVSVAVIALLVGFWFMRKSK